MHVAFVKVVEKLNKAVLMCSYMCDASINCFEHACLWNLVAIVINTKTNQNTTR